MRLNMLYPVVFLLTLILSSCVKDDFDAPPADGEDPAVTATTTILQLKQLFTGSPVQITDEVIISGIVISSDKEGNFYKSLIIQDSTAGIAIRIDQTDMYAAYPIGRRVFVLCKNLWLGDYANLVQLGGVLDESDPQNPGVGAIPSALVGNFILKGKYNIPVVPLDVSISQLNDAYQNRLIRLTGVEFDASESGQTYADAVNQFSRNRKVNDCDGFQIILRTSGYAAFAKDTVPQGNGTLTAIYSIFNSDKQLYINDTGDVQFGNPRCSAGGEYVSILSIRNAYSGSNVTLGQDKKIKGIVISDRANGNWDGRNMVLQDSLGGIVIRFVSTHSFNLNDEVEVDISGLTLTAFNGLVQVDQTPNSKALKTGTGAIVPETVTAAQLIASPNTRQSMLVKINDAQLSGGSTYAGTISLTDPTGTVNMFTRNAASFSGSSYPTGNVSVTCVVGNFNGLQVSIRNTSDVN